MVGIDLDRFGVWDFFFNGTSETFNKYSYHFHPEAREKIYGNLKGERCTERLLRILLTRGTSAFYGTANETFAKLGSEYEKTYHEMGRILGRHTFLDRISPGRKKRKLANVIKRRREMARTAAKIDAAGELVGYIEGHALDILAYVAGETDSLPAGPGKDISGTIGAIRAFRSPERERRKKLSDRLAMAERFLLGIISPFSFPILSTAIGSIGPPMPTWPRESYSSEQPPSNDTPLPPNDRNSHDESHAATIRPAGRTNKKIVVKKVIKGTVASKARIKTDKQSTLEQSTHHLPTLEDIFYLKPSDQRNTTTESQGFSGGYSTSLGLPGKKAPVRTEKKEVTIQEPTGGSKVGEPGASHGPYGEIAVKQAKQQEVRQACAEGKELEGKIEVSMKKLEPKLNAMRYHHLDMNYMDIPGDDHKKRRTNFYRTFDALEKRQRSIVVHDIPTLEAELGPLDTLPDNTLDHELAKFEDAAENYVEIHDSLVELNEKASNSIYEQAYYNKELMRITTNWQAKQVAIWEKKARASLSLADKKILKFDVRIKNAERKDIGRSKIERIQEACQKLVALKRDVQNSFNTWKKHLGDSDAKYKHSTAHHAFERMFINTATLTQRCKDYTKKYDLGVKGWKAWSVAGTMLAGLGIAWLIVEATLGVFNITSDPEDKGNTAPIPIDYATDTFDLEQGGNLTVDMNEMVEDTDGDIIKCNIADDGGLDAAIMGHSTLYVDAGNASTTPGIGKHVVSVSARDGHGHNIIKDVVINLGNSPAKMEDVAITPGGFTDAGDKIFKVLGNITEVQDIRSVSVDIDGEEIEIYNSTLGVKHLDLNEIVKLNRTKAPKKGANGYIVVTDVFEQESRSPAEIVEIPDHSSHVDIPDSAIAYTKSHYLDYNLSRHAGLIELPGIKVSDHDSTGQGDLVLSLKKDGKVLKQASTPLKIGTITANLTYDEGELEMGECSFEVEFNGEINLTEPAYVWGDGPEVDIEGLMVPIDHDFENDGAEAIHNLSFTIKNDVGQETRVTFEVNGTRIYNKTGIYTNGNQEMWIEHLGNGENAVRAVPSDFDSDNNPHITGGVDTTIITVQAMNQAPKVIGNLSNIICCHVPLTQGYPRNIIFAPDDLFHDSDGDELNITKVIFTGGDAVYEEGELCLNPLSEGEHTLTVFARDPDGAEVVASVSIKVVPPPRIVDLDCFTDSEGTLYLNGQVDRGAYYTWLNVIISQNGSEKGRFPVAPVDSDWDDDIVFNAMVQSALEPGIYDVKLEGEDINEAIFTNVLEDKLLIMDNSTRIEGDEDTPLSAGIINYINANANVIRTLGSDWKAILDDHLLNAVAGNSDYRQDDDKYAKFSAEMPIAFKFIRDNIAEPQHRPTLDLVKMIPMYSAGIGGSEGVFIQEDTNADGVYDAKYFGDVGAHRLFTMEQCRSWGDVFLVDEDHAKLGPADLQAQLKYSLMGVGDRKDILDDSFKDWQMHFSESAVLRLCALLNGTQGGDNNFTTIDYNKLVKVNSIVKIFFRTNGSDAGLILDYVADTGKFVYDIKTE